MDRPRTPGTQLTRLERTLAHLKILSRLLGHELHAQSAPRLTFSREEVAEIQTSIDLYIEEVIRASRGNSGAATREVEIATVEARAIN